MLYLKPQEIDIDDERSRYRFKPGSEKPFLITPAALEAYGVEVIFGCLLRLQAAAARHGGIELPAGLRVGTTERPGAALVHRR